MLRLKPVLFATAALIATVANAHDFNPPPWRGAPMSDFQHWLFSTPGPLPEISNNPFGQPAITDFGQSRWLETFEGQEGVWCIPEGSAMIFHIPDADEPTMLKLIRIQVTFWGTPADFQFLGDPFDFGFKDFGDGWTGAWADYERSCQPFDVALVGGPLYVDQLVVDAVCVPEPITMAGFGIAGLGVIARRRRKNS